MAALTPVKRTDPYDFPKSMVPLGLTYQWQAKTVCGEPSDQYESMLKAGWMPVPAQWHRPHFDCADGPVEIGGQVLLCHHKAKDEEAERIAGAQRNVDNWIKKYSGEFSGSVRAVTQTSENVSEQRRYVGDESTARKIIAATPMDMASLPKAPPPEPALPVGSAPPLNHSLPSHRVARWSALAWLFNFLSKEV